MRGMSIAHPPLDRSLPLRERKKLRTRRALADAALRLFTEKGFDATTLEELAEEAEERALGDLGLLGQFLQRGTAEAVLGEQP